MKKNIMIVLLIVSMIAAINAETAEGGKTYIWTMDTAEEIAKYGDDNTQTKFELNTNKEFVMQGAGSVIVTPSGSAIETKLALDVVKKDIKTWMKAKIVKVNVFLPNANKMNPKEFFLGMGDVSNPKKFIWIDGVFFEKMEVKPGWNTVKFILLPKMTDLKPSKKYKIFFISIGRDKDNVKAPLSEKFYVDGIYFEN